MDECRSERVPPDRQPVHRLAVYGTLAPGRVNSHQLEELRGHWQKGTVRGRLVEAGWGASLGYPGLILDRLAEPIEVHLLESRDLPGHWDRLDAFEGRGYRRVTAQVRTEQGEVDAWSYVLAGDERSA